MRCRAPLHITLGSSLVAAMALAVTGCGQMVLGRLPGVAHDSGSDGADASSAPDAVADQVAGDMSDAVWRNTTPFTMFTV